MLELKNISFNVSDEKGETYVSCALGFPGGTYNGGKAINPERLWK